LVAIQITDPDTSVRALAEVCTFQCFEFIITSFYNLWFVFLLGSFFPRCAIIFNCVNLHYLWKKNVFVGLYL